MSTADATRAMVHDEMLRLALAAGFEQSDAARVVWTPPRPRNRAERRAAR